jgi:hypothetical protein
MYFLFGIIIGSSLLGFIVAIFIESKSEIIGPEKIMWFGFFLLFPIMFFKGYFEETFWYDVFGILAVIGSFILIVNFSKMLRKVKSKKKK